MAEELALADIVRMLRDSILDLQREKQESGRAPLWKISDCEIELHVVAREAKSIDGKVAAAIFATSAGKAYSSEQVHKIKLRLTPFLQGADPKSDKESMEIPAFLRRQAD